MYRNVDAELVFNQMAKWFAVRPHDSVGGLLLGYWQQIATNHSRLGKKSCKTTLP